MVFSKKTLAQDLKSGFFVFLLALPLSLGIAIASGFPPIAGIFTAVIGGMITPFFGGARLTIKGPAAGLIVIVIGAVTELGMGDPILGYKRTIAVAAVAAIVQIIFGFSKAGIIGEIIPKSVVHGMLSAIGVIIISKQCHNLLGVTPIGKNPLTLLAEFPTHLLEFNPEVSFIAVLTLMTLFFWPKLARGILKAVPAAILALLGSMVLAYYFDFDHAHNYQILNQTYSVSPSYLINLPASFFSAMTFPDFGFITNWLSIKYIIVLSLVGSIESLLTVSAADSMDPQKRSSSLNKDLIAAGVGNLIAALIGGLPMISEIVRSKANIDNGAESSQSNFFHGMFLLVAVAMFPNVLHLIPVTTLAAMLVFTGFRLASVNEFKHAFKLGIDQFIPFLATFFITLGVDLLLGVIAGVVVQQLMSLYLGQKLNDFFKLDVEESEHQHKIILKVKSSVGFIHLFKLKKKIKAAALKSRTVEIDLSEAPFVEHSCFVMIETLKQASESSINIVGVTSLRASSTDPLSTKYQ